MVEICIVFTILPWQLRAKLWISHRWFMMQVGPGLVKSMQRMVDDTGFKSNGAVAIVIVNYGTADLAADAVRSVLDHPAGGRDIAVHLVDNASPGDDAATFTRLHKAEGWGDRVTLYLEDENHGFGRGNNVVLDALLQRDAPPEFIMLLNPDAKLRNNAPDILASFLQDHPDVGAAGAQISKPGEGPVTAAFRFPTALVEFVSAANIGPLTKLAGNQTLWHAPDIATGPVDWVAGAAVMFRTRALQDAGTFDPDFFLYFEEVELMWRLAQHGWPCWYVAEAQVDHVEGAATDVRSGEVERTRKPAYWYQSQQLYYDKTASPLVAATRATARYKGAVLNRVAAMLRGRAPDLPKAFFGDFAKLVLMPQLARPFQRTTSAPQPRMAAGAPLSQAQSDIQNGTALCDGINKGTTNRNPSDISLIALIAEDFRTHDSDIFAQGFWALFWHRFGNWRMGIRPRILRLPFTLIYRVGYKLAQWMGGIKLPYTVVVGRRLKLEHFGGMILVARAIGDDVVIRQNVTFGISDPARAFARPTIGDRVDVGAGAVIMGDVSIGHDTVIGANSVVNRSQPEGVTVVGAPARVVSKRRAVKVA